MDLEAIPIVFIPRIKHQTRNDNSLKIKSKIFKSDLFSSFGALNLQEEDYWTSAWTISFPETKIFEYQYDKEDILRTLDLESLPIDLTKAKSTICVLEVDDVWKAPKDSKITFTQVPIKDDKCCIVLGKCLEKDGSPTPELVSRMEKFAKIMNSKPDFYKISILSGSKVNQKVNYEADVMYDLGIKMGIEPQLMIKEREAKSTFENAIFAKIIACKMGYVNFDVISSNYHLRRSEEIFKKVFGSQIFKFTMIEDEFFLPDDILKSYEANERIYFYELKENFEYFGFF